MIKDMRGSYVPEQECACAPKWKDIGGFPVNSAAKEAIKEKHASHRNCMNSLRHGDPIAARARFRKASNNTKRLIRKFKRQFESSFAESSKTNPKPFWAHVRGRLKTKEGIAPLLQDPNDKSSMKFTDEEKANILQTQFSSVYTHEPEDEAPECNHEQPSQLIRF